MAEPRVVVADREHLWWLLAEAAQLEHRHHGPARPAASPRPGTRL